MRRQELRKAVGPNAIAISPVLFAVLVIMAAVTTLATTPLLGLFAASDAADAVPKRDGAAS